MAFKIIWSRSAREDLRQVVWFIKYDNPKAAEAFGFALMKRVDILENFPRLGRVVPELAEETIRELIYRSYRIVYQVIEEQNIVVVVRIWHGARGEPELPARLEY
jgi:toxin ParE1/3/4